MMRRSNLAKSRGTARQQPKHTTMRVLPLQSTAVASRCKLHNLLGEKRPKFNVPDSVIGWSCKVTDINVEHLTGVHIG